MDAKTVQKAWMDGYDAGLAEAASRQSRSKALLAALVYHEGKATEANLYIRLHHHTDDHDMVEYWTRERNKHTDMAKAITEANMVLTNSSASNKERIT